MSFTVLEAKKGIPVQYVTVSLCSYQTLMSRVEVRPEASGFNKLNFPSSPALCHIGAYNTSSFLKSESDVNQYLSLPPNSIHSFRIFRARSSVWATKRTLPFSVPYLVPYILG